MKKLLVIGASVLQLPGILKAKEMGFHVGVIDYNPNAVGVPYADEYFNVSTIDIEGVVNTALSFRPDGIITLATDMPMRAVSKACKACGLPGISFDTAVKATDKAEMIKSFEEHQVEHPWYRIIENREELLAAANTITFPCVMKPTDNAGSKGVVLCKSKEELSEEYEYSYGESRSGRVIIEQYMKGPEFSVEIIALDGEPHVLQITEKITTGAPFFVEMGHTQPSTRPEKEKQAICDLACRAVKAIGIDNGPAHVEIILTESGPKMVELGARMGGDCITTHLVPLSTGIDMIKATIDIACGLRPDIEARFCKGAAIRYINCPNGIIKSIRGVESARTLSGVTEVTMSKKPGDRIDGIKNSNDRPGFVIAQAENAKKAGEICAEAMQKIVIEMEE